MAVFVGMLYFILSNSVFIVSTSTALATLAVVGISVYVFVFTIERRHK
jgi:heme O synthase-like polyprenyltransferase